MRDFLEMQKYGRLTGNQSTRVEFLDKKLDDNLTVYVYVIRNTQLNFVFIKLYTRKKKN